MNTEPNNAQTIAELVRSTADPKTASIDGIPYVVIPQQAQLVSLEHLLEKPVRARGTVQVHTMDSFARYVSSYSTLECLAIFADVSASACKITAILDYHQRAKNDLPTAGCREHTVVFSPLESVEFKRWRDKNGLWFNQLDFAAWLQDNQQDVVTPPGAHLLEIATTLQAKKEVNFRRSEVLANGTAQFTYDEVMKAGGGASGQLEIPSVFELELAMHQGGVPRTFTARLRYKIEEGRLAFRYDLVGLHKIIERNNAELIQQVEELTECTPYVGAAK